MTCPREAFWWQARHPLVDDVAQRIAWPILRRLLQSDHTLKTLSAITGRSARQLERAFFNPHKIDMATLSDLVWALDLRMDIAITEAPEPSP